MPRLLSVNVGLPRDVAWHGETVRTAIWKEPVQGRRMVRRLNIDGDKQGDLNGHGGEQRAVFVYQMDSYRYWERQLGRNDFVFGQFGENFTISGLLETVVCIGDVWRIGSARLQVTAPRLPCFKFGHKIGRPDILEGFLQSGHSGFYHRVLTEGQVQAGDLSGLHGAEIDLVQRNPAGRHFSVIPAAMLCGRENQCSQCVTQRAAQLAR